MRSHATPNNNAREDLTLLEDTVREAGHIARRFYGGDYKKWHKEEGSPVTEADLAVNKYLCDTLTAARPEYGWLSEETTDDPARLARRTVFIIDPIDGTVAFLKNRPHFTICAGIVADGRPVCGVVYNPISDELYSARTGAGAHRNGTPIHVSARHGLEDCAMLGDRTQLTAAPFPPMHVQNRNSVAYRLVLVADGSADASVSLTCKRDWDLAAADIILHEAGGCLTDARGAVMTYNRPVTKQSSLVAANPRLSTEIISLLRQ
ncbi:MAG: 3'(2'),5'-bisphosphate nucleotidase CysQ [Alphaproteobacteria bacterium]|nr:3'(2'),5'-bisphosphate nucleotidase CysQ [Alphaproteobacteria bacterium]